MAHPTKPAGARYRKRRQTAIAATASELPDLSEATERVLDVVADATDDQWAAGMGWYHNAHDVCVELAAEHGVTVRQATAIVAVLSPQTPWGPNVEMAGRFLSGERGLHVGLFEQRGEAILAGAEPLDELGGRKVRSFYRNLLRPDHVGYVTIDRHAVAIAYGFRGVDPHVLDRIAAYQLVAAPYRAAARVLGIRPHETQAIAWTVWRDRHVGAWITEADPF